MLRRVRGYQSLGSSQTGADLRASYAAHAGRLTV